MLPRTPRLYIIGFSQRPVVEVSETFYCREKFDIKTVKNYNVFSKRKSIVMFS